jgi:hypothetical protein
MENLPIELQLLIFGSLSSLEDLKSVRTVSKTCSQLISPRLFEKIIVTTGSDSFQRLTSISESQVARHVRCLHYDLFALPLVFELQGEEVLDYLRSSYSSDEFDAKFATYQEYEEVYDGQVFENEVDLWKNAFNRLSSLTSLEVSEHESHMNKKNRMLISRITSVLAGASAAWSHGENWGPARLDCLLTAIHATSRRLTSLSLDSVRSSWLELIASRQWNKRVAAESVFADLKVFSMSVTPLYRARDTQTARFLQKAIMKHAQNLIEIQIRAARVNPSQLWNVGTEPFYNVQIKSIHLDHLWNIPSQKYSIGSLKLEEMSASSSQLHNLFQALAPTLEVLNLKYIQLSSGSWTFMWRSMAETLQLRKVTLSGHFGAPSESWNKVERGKINSQHYSSWSEDPPTTPWPQMMFDLRCFFWETKPTNNILDRLEEWILSKGQGEFPLVPFYIPRCLYHHSTSMRIYNAYSRESAVRELLRDNSFDFVRDDDLHNTPEELAISCPKTCRNYVDKRDPIATSLFQEHYIKQLLTCLMVLQRIKLVTSSCYFHPKCFAGEEGLPSCCDRHRLALVESYSDDMSTLAITNFNPDPSGESGWVSSHHQRCLSIFGRQAITLIDARREIERTNSDAPSITYYFENIIHYSGNIIYLVENFIKVVDTLNGNGLFENLCDGAQHMTASRQARSFYELLMKAAGEGLLLQDALHE